MRLFLTLIFACEDGPSPRDLYGPEPLHRAYIQIDEDAACPIDYGNLLGYCLTSADSFAADGSTECGGVRLSATVWMPGDALSTTSFTLQDDSTTPASGTAAVWLDQGDETWVSSAGSASLTRGVLGSGGEVITVSFEGEFETFIGGEPGPTASGLVHCELPDQSVD